MLNLNEGRAKKFECPKLFKILNVSINKDSNTIDYF